MADFSIDILNKFRVFCQALHEQYDIPLEVMHDILKNENVVKVKAKIPLKEKTSQCTALLKSGARKGQQCTLKATEASNFKYCTRHKKVEDNIIPDKEDEIVFKKNKFGYLTYGKTGLILKSDEERFIIGRQDESGNILDLDDDGIDICKRKKFKFVKCYSNFINNSIP